MKILLHMYNKEIIPISTYMLVDGKTFNTVDEILEYINNLINEDKVKYFKINSTAGTMNNQVMISQICTIEIK